MLQTCTYTQKVFKLLICLSWPFQVKDLHWWWELDLKLQFRDQTTVFSSQHSSLKATVRWPVTCSFFQRSQGFAVKIDVQTVNAVFCFNKLNYGVYLPHKVCFGTKWMENAGDYWSHQHSRCSSTTCSPRFISCRCITHANTVIGTTLIRTDQ